MIIYGLFQKKNDYIWNDKRLLVVQQPIIMQNVVIPERMKE